MSGIAAVLKIPLLFETGAEILCDTVILVTAPLHVRKARTLERTGMTTAKFQAITKQQISEADKCRRADYIVPTAKGMQDKQRQLKKILEKLIVA